VPTTQTAESGGAATLAATSLSEQYRALTEGCGLLDRSERGKLALSGAGAVEFLDGQVTNELRQIGPGEGRYAAFLTHKGKMLGDLRVLAPAEGGAPGEVPAELLLDTERCTLQALFDMISRFKVGYDVELHKRTLESSLLSLIGPRTSTVLSAVAEVEELPGSEHANLPARVGGRPVLLVVTAEPAGVDVLCEAADLQVVQEALLAGGAEAIGEAAAEIARVEHGRPRYGIDLDETVIPQEAGLNERAVSFTKGCYVGQETVARLHYKGRPNRHLRGLRSSRQLASGTELSLRGRSVGRVASSVLSPLHGPIALALIRREAEPGMLLQTGEGSIDATVTELPFSA
jgi:tRNA-modifying protein YgfZ